MQAQLKEVQKELREVQNGLRSVFQALDFLHGFVESEFGMRYQFQAYKSTSPIHQQIIQELETLRTKFGKSVPDSGTNAHHISSSSTSLSHAAGTSASAPVLSGISYQNYLGNQPYSQPQPTSFATAPDFMSTLSASSSNAFQYHQNQNPHTSQNFTTSDFQPPHQQFVQVGVDVKTNVSLLSEDAYHDDDGNDDEFGNDDDCDTGNEGRSSTMDESETCDSEVSNSNKGKKKKQPKKKVIGKDNWAREKAKIMRMRGEAYTGHLQVMREDGKRQFVQVKPIASRKLGPPCTSQHCAKSKVRHCQEFPENAREALFKQFWHEFDWDQKKIFVLSNVERDYIKRSTVPVPENRSKTETFHYFLPLGDQRLQVCRNMFTSTLNLGRGMVTMWVKKLAPLPEEKPEPYFPKRKNMKKSERISPKQKKPPKPGFKCPYCLDLFSSRSEFQTHLSKHMSQYDTGKSD